MTKLALILALTLTAANAFADPIKTPASYSCTSDRAAIQGNDGSIRSCWPYHCQAGGFGGVYGSACYTYCNTSDMCANGTVCDTASSTCVTPGH